MVFPYNVIPPTHNKEWNADTYYSMGGPWSVMLESKIARHTIYIIFSYEKSRLEKSIEHRTSGLLKVQGLEQGDRSMVS